jgi:hypothetical protein
MNSEVAAAEFRSNAHHAIIASATILLISSAAASRAE